MSLQTIIDSATNIQINRSKLVAQSISRSGRILTASRNWANPFRLTISPKPIWLWSDYRDEFETIFNYDRYTEHTIYLSNFGQTKTDLDWISEYRGTAPHTLYVLDNFVVDAAGITGTTINLDYSGNTTTNNGKYIVRKGDWIRPTDHDYPYQVTADVQIATGVTDYAVQIHRGYIPESGYTPAGKTVTVGRAAAKLFVKVTKLPALSFINKGLVQFTGDFELIEVIQ